MNYSYAKVVKQAQTDAKKVGYEIDPNGSDGFSVYVVASWGQRFYVGATGTVQAAARLVKQDRRDSRKEKVL